MKRWAALLLLVACHQPPPEDPGEVAYRAAVQLFATVSAETHNLGYANPRFDGVLKLLAEVPANDELAIQAEELAKQIRDGRARAAAQAEDSQRQVDEAAAAPPFDARPHDAPFPSMRPVADPRAPAWSAPARMARDPATGLPDWYRKAGYGKSRGEGTTTNTPTPTDTAAATDTAATANTATGAATTAAPAKPPPVNPDQPPAVYGLPGPAARALSGHP